MSWGSASKVWPRAHGLRTEPLELWARTLYWKWLNGVRSGLASKNSSGPVDQMKTSSSSSVPRGRLRQNTAVRVFVAQTLLWVNDLDQGLSKAEVQMCVNEPYLSTVTHFEDALAYKRPSWCLDVKTTFP